MNYLLKLDLVYKSLFFILLKFSDPAHLILPNFPSPPLIRTGPVITRPKSTYHVNMTSKTSKKRVMYIQIG